MTPDDLAAIRKRAEAAAEHVGRLCTKEAHWQMSVPPRDDDSDLMLMAVLDTDVPALLAEVERLTRENERYRTAAADVGPRG